MLLPLTQISVGGGCGGGGGGQKKKTHIKTVFDECAQKVKILVESFTWHKIETQSILVMITVEGLV